MNIGLKIKELRLKAELTQEELADRCELSKGFISQVENDLTSPSISTLEDILCALGTDMTEFFAGNKNEEQVVFTKEDYFEKETENSLVTWLITNSQKNEMEPILITITPDSSTDEDMPHEGEEFGYIITGSVKLVIGDKAYRAREGDSFYFAAAKKHYIINNGTETAKILWISSPPNF
ncbi:MAG: cupin domain-containing protein [Firmicutes bacterium]|nr:cupin domain-containing protein [Bacillota bacterium]